MMRRLYVEAPFIKYFLVYLLLFVSGTSRYMMAQNKYFIVIFVVALVAWYIYTDRKISSRFLLFITIFCGFLFILSLYTGGSLSVASVISTTMRLFFAYLIIRTIGPDIAQVYIKLVVFLAAISLFGYAIDIGYMFDALVTRLPRFGMGYEGFFYTFKHAYHPERNNSIFFEPGAYQAFLNAAIFLIVFAETKLASNIKWIYIAILLAALATAGSTTGYIIFAVMLVLFLYRSDMATHSQKFFSVGVIIVVVTIFSAQFYSNLIVKMEDYLNPDESRRGWSSENRSFDLQTDLIIIKKHVFGLGFDKYKDEFRLIGQLDNSAKSAEGSSNGITSTLAGYGVPFGIYLFASYFLAIRSLMRDIVLALSGYMMFVLFLWGESYYTMAPISLAIIAAAFVFDESVSCRTGEEKSPDV